MVGIGTALVVIGIVVTVLSAVTIITVEGGVALGIGLMIAGVTLIAFGAPNLGFGDKIKKLCNEMAPGIKDFQNACDLIISTLNSTVT